MNPVATRRFIRNPVALATALVMVAGATPALAQSFSQAGANNTFPNNLLPYAGNPSSLDFTGDQVFIGNGGVGSFSAMAGALLKADGLAIGTAGNGTGTFAASGAGTRIELGGTAGRLGVGSWGTGTMTVSAGAVVDATLNPGVCAGNSCNNFIGNGAGSTATLIITGAGSAVRTLRNTTIGQSSVFTNPPNSSAFGTPGGTTNASISVLDGGLFATERATVGFNNGSPNGNGQERAFGTVTVSGAGSQWLMTRNSIDNQAAGLSIGVNFNGDGKLTLSNGGKMRIDGTGSPAGQGDFVNLGSNNGRGELTVTGVGSSLDMVGPSGAIQAGRSGASGSGSFSVLAGASASAVFLNVGRDAASGTVTVDGAGSLLRLSGEGTYSAGGLGSAVASIGWAGTGQVTVSNGALWQVDDGGTNSSASNRGPGINVGIANAGVGGNGSLNISGTGSRVELSSTTLSPALNAPDNGNPYVNIGRESGSTGNVTISAGGKLLITGNALSTPTHGRTTFLGVGGHSDTVSGGNGTLTVTGSGSEVRLNGTDAFVTVGRSGTGTMNLTDGALLQATILNTGRAAGSNGTLTMDASAIVLSGQFTDTSGSGAGVTIGNRGGTGSMTMANGSVVNITNPGSAGASFNLGGTTLSPLGTGTLLMSGGSQITIAAAGLASATFGRDGSGIATLSGASQIDIGDGGVHVGRLAGGSGSVTLQSGSKILSGTANIGGSSEAVAGGAGNVTVTGLGSELRASGASGFIGVGRNGTGGLQVSDQGQVSAITMSVGRGATGSGALVVDNATLEMTGQQTSGNLVGASLAVGVGGGSGVATFGNGSRLNITNLGSAGAGVTIGGSSNFPLGTGTLALAGASQLRVTAAPGLATVSIGRDGLGTAVLSEASSIDVGDGSVYVAREPGSVGTLVLTGGSTLNAGYVGIGVSAPYNGVAQAIGGSGTVVLNDSTINAGKFEIGAGSILTGNNGVLNVVGDVIVGGILSPGNSPGRLRINCNIITLAGSQLILDIEEVGNGSYAFDELVLGPQATFNLYNFEVVFNFIGSTDPNAFAATGQFELDTFLRAAVGNVESGLSTTFAPGQNWTTVLDPTQVSYTSAMFGDGELAISADGSVTAVPEPASWGLMFLGLVAVGGLARWRGQQSTMA